MTISVKDARTLYPIRVASVTGEQTLLDLIREAQKNPSHNDLDPNMAVFVEGAILPFFLLHSVPMGFLDVETVKHNVLRGHIGTVLGMSVYTDAYERLHDHFITDIELRAKNNNV